jgi:hypothetical protein
MEVLTVKEFCKSRGFTQIVPKVRQNSNGYPYLTFLTESNEAENIYFSKSAGEHLQAGDKIDSLVPYQIAITQNADGEVRTKIISNSDRVSVDSLLG